METLLLRPDTQGIDRAAALLRDGELVAIPTETVYGLAADALNPTAVRAIFAAKGRPVDNPLIVHIADIDAWAPLVRQIPEAAKKLAEAYWPGPLTIILPASPIVPPEVTGGLSTVAVRFPAHPVAQAVILRAGCPLAAPSANRSGAPSPTNARRVTEDMQGRIAAVLDGGVCDVGVESTVVDLSGEHPRLLRPGGITPAMLEAVLGEIEIDPAVTHALKEGSVAASPGMKYKHYAPKAQVYLVKGTTEQYTRFVNARKAPGVAALCFDEATDSLTVPALSYGKKDDPADQAQQLFDALRRLDEMGAETVYAQSPCPQGVGLAVYNRLIRAAAFRVLHTTRVIGLTGPTGAGKSTVADEWKKRGAVIIDADVIARQITEKGSPCLAELVQAFSPAILCADGSLDRAALAKVAFSCSKNTKRLNDITHPAITRIIRDRLEETAENGQTAVIDAPLLFEAGVDALCDTIVAVLSPLEARLARICARDGIDEQAARRRISAQPEDGFYRRDGVHIVDNLEDEPALRQKAGSLWDTLTKGE